MMNYSVTLNIDGCAVFTGHYETELENANEVFPFLTSLVLRDFIEATPEYFNLWISRIEINYLKF